MADKEIHIPFKLTQETQYTLIDDIVMKVTETSEQFIFSTISQWYEQTTQRKVEKQELVNALINYHGVAPELEGDPANGYWTVCGECHGTLNRRDKFCHECGRKVLWDA